jgi:ADP-heptose:LPS heptosyltransferase
LAVTGPATTPVARVVALRPLGLGDLCTAVPALRALRRHWPAAELVLAAPAWQAPLAALSGVDRVVDTAEHGPLAAELAGPDVAVNLHGRGPESTRRALTLAPRRLIAFEHPDVPATAGGAVWRDGGHELSRWCRLLEHEGIAADPADLRLHLPAGTSSPDAGVVVLHPGAAAVGRRWPAERFGTVAAALAGRAHRIVVVGSADEREVCAAVVAHAAHPAVSTRGGQTSVWELARLLAGAALFVGNDSGVAHLATATGVPSVVLFGPTSPGEWGPPPSRRHVALWKGRVGDPRARQLDAGLAAISVAEVLAAADAVLRAAAAPERYPPAPASNGSASAASASSSRIARPAT